MIPSIFFVILEPEADNTLLLLLEPRTKLEGPELSPDPQVLEHGGKYNFLAAAS
jgi:hypothetical protein